MCNKTKSHWLIAKGVFLSQNVFLIPPSFLLSLFGLFLGYTSAGTPYKVPPTQSNGAPPPYTPTPTPYPTAMYPIRSAYPQQNIYAQVRRLNESWPHYLRDGVCSLPVKHSHQICDTPDLLAFNLISFFICCLVNILTTIMWSSLQGLHKIVICSCLNFSFKEFSVNQRKKNKIFAPGQIFYLHKFYITFNLLWLQGMSFDSGLEPCTVCGT